MNKKPITEISSEDLLKVLEDNKDIKEETNVIYKNDIIDFISQFNLKQGEEKISTRLLYSIYKPWSKLKLSKKTFTFNLRSFFLLTEGNDNKELMVLLNLDYNQLLKKTLINSKKKVKTRRKFYKEHFESYLMKYSIKKGSFFVKDSILYNLYDKWIYSFKKRNPLNITQINAFFKIFNFSSKIIDNDSWFGVDKSIIQHLSKDNLAKMRKHAEKTDKT